MKLATPVRFAALFAMLAAAACHGGPDAKQPGGPNGPNGEVGESGPLGPGGKRANVAFAVEAPLSLTASDGTGLAITGMSAKAVVDGSLAFTELTLSFNNPSDRTLEGTFRIALPRSASLGRFAMKVDGQWQEGEVVELEQARRAYEDFLHRRQDPALMEKAAGNEFSARVFPIPAHGTKEIVVAYVEEVKGVEYTLPLKGLPELGAIDVDVKVMGSTERKTLNKKSYTPTADMVVTLPKQEGSVRSGELAIIRVQPQGDSKPDPLDNVMVLVDTSASRVLGFEEELKAVEELVKKISGNVTVAAFDQTVTSIYSGAATGFGGRELGALKAREALGASNLETAFAFVKDNAKKQKARRVVIVGDGVVTAGATDPKKLLPRVTALKDVGIERIDAVGIGGIRDDVMLGRIVRGTLANDGVVADVADMGRKLSEKTRSGIAVRVEGATWSWPTKLDGVQAGDMYSVYATIPESAPLKVSFDNGAVQKINARITDRPLVERAVSQAKVSSMLEREASGKENLKRDIVQVAVKNRIMTPYTAMLVLETEQDYVRYGIKRTSLADVLAISDGNVKRLHRDAIRIATNDGKAPMADAPDDEMAPSKDLKAMEKKPEPPRERPRDMASADKKRGDSAPPPPPNRPSPKPAASAADPLATAELSRSALSESPAAKAEAGPVAQGRRPAGPSTPAAAPPPPPPPPPPSRVARPQMEAANDGDSVASFSMDSQAPGRQDRVNPYEGKFKDVMERIRDKRADEARKMVDAWRAESPGDVLALVALGEVAESQANWQLASRAYGSVIDLFSNRADLRRFAGERLERVAMKDAAALDMAIDSFEKAFADRPDHPSSGRLLTYALVRKKNFARAFEVAVQASQHGYEVDRYRGVDRILREDVGLVAAAWAKAEPGKRAEIMQKLRQAGGEVEDKPSLRFVLNWETDANDVDFHIHDSRGGHAFFSNPRLPSGGELYADVTTGYGPECFTIRTPKNVRVAPYHLDAHYYSRGPMGYGMGKLEIIEHDGNGNLTFEERPFIVMVDGAFVDLGEVR